MLMAEGKNLIIHVEAIKWDLDYLDEINHLNLPENVSIDEETFNYLYPDVDLKDHDKTLDCIADWLSNTYGYCVKSFQLPLFTK